MKPSDRDDFFRLPAPDGRGRESTIVLDRSGGWHHEGAPVEHEGLARGLASWVRRHPDDGRYILSNGYDWCYFAVECAPFFVASVWADHGQAHVRLTDGSVEPLLLESLVVDEDGVCGCKVRDGAFDARFTRGAQLMLGALLCDCDAAAISVAGRVYTIRSRAGEDEDEAARRERG